MLNVWNVSDDEKNAIHALGTLIRAVEKWDADERTKKRAHRAKNWLDRYNAKYPARILRDGAQLSQPNNPNTKGEER